MILTKFDGKAAHGPRKKASDFDGNPDQVTLGFGFGLGVGAIDRDAGFVLPGTCLVVSVLRHQRTWPSYRLY